MCRVIQWECLASTYNTLFISFSVESRLVPHCIVLVVKKKRSNSTNVQRDRDTLQTNWNNTMVGEFAGNSFFCDLRIIMIFMWCGCCCVGSAIAEGVIIAVFSLYWFYEQFTPKYGCEWVWFVGGNCVSVCFHLCWKIPSSVVNFCVYISVFFSLSVPILYT